MKKKIISLVLAVIFAFTFAVSTAVSAFAADAAITISKTNETATTVTIAVGISGNPGIAALGVDLGFDSTLLSGVGVESAGVAKTAGMVAYGSFSGGNVRIVVEEGNSGEGTKFDGVVCVVTFKKLSTVKDGTSASFTANVIDSLTYDLDGEDVTIAGGSATVSLEAVAETTTKKPAATNKPSTTKKPATTKKPTTTKKPATTKKPVTTKPNVTSHTLPGVTIPTTAETTTEEITTEEFTTEYESYSYTAPVDSEVENEDVDKADNTKRIVAIVIVVVCAGAAAALYFFKRK